MSQRGANTHPVFVTTQLPRCLTLLTLPRSSLPGAYGVSSSRRRPVLFKFTEPHYFPFIAARTTLTCDVLCSRSPRHRLDWTTSRLFPPVFNTPP